MYFKIIILSIAVLLYKPAHTQVKQTGNNYVVLKPTDTPEDIIKKAANVIPSAKQLRWQQLELTAFFHFGINTFTDREWGDGKESPALFNPTELDAEQWVKAVKKTGIKQVILTAKHHDGFCLWPSKYTEHSVKNSPWKNGQGDVVKEVANACRKNNIGFGIYLSPWDRNASSYGTDAYNGYFVNQLTELLTQYGRVDELWFDGANGEGPNGKKQVYDFTRWFTLIRKLQPNAVIAIMGPDVRWVGTESGYGRETEWSVVPADNLDATEIAARSQKEIVFKPMGDMTGDNIGGRDKIFSAKGLVWYPAETDVSIRPGWFYHANEDAKVKSPEKLLDIYFNSVGRNGVLLLNIPPDKRGLIHDADIKSLEGWKKLRDSIFKKNLVANATITCANARNTKAITDGNYNTWFTTNNKDTTTTIEFSLKNKSTFDVLVLQENIKTGQHIEKFRLDYWNNNEWKTAAKGTTVGYKRIITFDAVTAGKVRLVIESSRLNPAIAEIGLY